MIALQSEQRPCARGENGRVRRVKRSRCEGRRGVMPRYGVYREAREAVMRKKLAKWSACLQRLPGKRRRRKPEALDDRSGPCSAAGVEEPGGRGDRGLVRQLAAQPVTQDARDGVELLARDARVRASDHAVGAAVAVVEREPQHAAAPIEQRVVDAPRVDADAAQLGPR